MPWSFLSSRTGAGTSVGTLPRGWPGCPLLGLHASSFALFTCRHPREHFLLEPSHRLGQACEAPRGGALSSSAAPRSPGQLSLLGCRLAHTLALPHPWAAAGPPAGSSSALVRVSARAAASCWRGCLSAPREPAEGKGESGLLIQPPDTPSAVHLHSFAMTAHSRPVA